MLTIIFIPYNLGLSDNLFKKYKFYFIDDIILRYLEIFDMDEEIVEDKIKNLKEKLGEKFIYIIGNDLRYLDEILDYDE